MICVSPFLCLQAVLPLTLPGSLVLMSGQVFAASENEEIEEPTLLTDEVCVLCKYKSLGLRV